MQAFVLASLARCGFFSHAAFQGGTCLRMLHGMSRFSEDLDFLLRKPAARFRWQAYVSAVQRDCAEQGIHFGRGPRDVRPTLPSCQACPPSRHMEGLRIGRVGRTSLFPCSVWASIDNGLLTPVPPGVDTFFVSH